MHTLLQHAARIDRLADGLRVPPQRGFLLQLKVRRQRAAAGSSGSAFCSPPFPLTVPAPRPRCCIHSSSGLQFRIQRRSRPPQSSACPPTGMARAASSCASEAALSRKHAFQASVRACAPPRQLPVPPASRRTAAAPASTAPESVRTAPPTAQNKQSPPGRQWSAKSTAENPETPAATRPRAKSAPARPPESPPDRP